MMNNASVSTAESLRVSLRSWIDGAVHGLGVMPLLTAACQSLASVRHMAETTEACVTAYFNEGENLHHQICLYFEALRIGLTSSAVNWLTILLVIKWCLIL